VKSGLRPDEIVRFAHGEIKSTLPPSRRISSTSADFIGVRRFIPPVRVDLVEKTSSCDEVFSGYWGRKRCVCVFAGRIRTPGFLSEISSFARCEVFAFGKREVLRRCRKVKLSVPRKRNT